jgi:ubiquitin-conjugating enzyme E2 J1
MASTAAGYSKRSSSVKRLLQEAKELAGAAEDGIHAAPFEENLYHWHFTIEGPKDSEFDGGLYHGRICVSLVWSGSYCGYCQVMQQ